MPTRSSTLLRAAHRCGLRHPPSGFLSAAARLQHPRTRDRGYGVRHNLTHSTVPEARLERRIRVGAQAVPVCMPMVCARDEALGRIAIFSRIAELIDRESFMTSDLS